MGEFKIYIIINVYFYIPIYKCPIVIIIGCIVVLQFTAAYLIKMSHQDLHLQQVPPRPSPPTGPGTLRIQVCSIGADGTSTFNMSPPAGGVSTVTITTIGGSRFIDIPNVDPGTYTITQKHKYFH